MSMYVILQQPNEGYYLVCKAATNKHFFLVDKGWNEVLSGRYDIVLQLMFDLEERQKEDLIELYCADTFSLIQTTDECLKQILINQPDYLNNKEFI